MTRPLTPEMVAERWMCSAETVRHTRARPLLLPLIYFTDCVRFLLHVSYGLRNVSHGNGASHNGRNEMNIRNEADRTAIAAKGFTWVTVTPRGENKGQVCSKHKSYDAANKAARGVDRAILEVSESWTY